MSPTVIVVIVLVAIVIALGAILTIRAAAARRALKERYGAEYDRVIEEHGGRSAGEAELRRRTRAHHELALKELTWDQTASYRAAWTDVQGRFIDDPTAAVRAADHLVSTLVADRGYPAVDFDARVAYLSVDHASVLSTYRDAHVIAVHGDAGTASTENLRQALVLYRALIADLLGDPLLNEPSAIGAVPNSHTDSNEKVIPNDRLAPNDQVEALPTEIPDDVRDLTTGGDEIAPAHASSTGDRRPTASTTTNTA